MVVSDSYGGLKGLCLAVSTHYFPYTLPDVVFLILPDL
jgi:hypothetical protein